MHALLQASRAFASRQQGSGVEGALPAPATEKAARLGADFLVRRETGEPGIQRLRLVPWSLVAATVEEGVRGLRPPPPDHAGVRVTVAGRSFGFESAATRLAMATAPMEPAGEVPPLEVGVFLASRDRLFATHTRRQALMAGWILLACAGGVGGLIVTWRALERQRRLAEERANFVASVSHELRAPVAAISLMVENMAGGVPLSADRRQEYHRLILRECRRLGALVENVLDISRIDRGAKRYHPEPTALVPLVTATVELMRHPAAQCGVTIETDLPPTADLQAVVDGRAIQQALVNLLDNAIKHSPAGGSPVRVLVGTRGNDAVIAVTDAGPGIPADQQQHIFERFRRLGSELRRETEGVGIGLALTRHILEAHRGTVEVESQPGKGSRFTLRFPITPEASKADGTDGPLHERKNEPG
jgi:signal transduction histidine kinase